MRNLCRIRRLKILELMRGPPAIRQLPNVLVKHGIEVNPRPFEKFAEYVEGHEEYMWVSLRNYLEGKSLDECYLKTSVIKSKIYRFIRSNKNGKHAAKLLTDVAKTLYESLSQSQRCWLEENGEKLLMGFELADAGVIRGEAALGTTDGFNILFYALAKYATGRKLLRLYLSALNLTKKGARPMYAVYAEPTLSMSKKTLYKLAKEGKSLLVQVVNAFRNPAAWLGLLLGDGTILHKYVGVATDVPELVSQLIPYTTNTYHSYKVTLKRFVADLVVRRTQLMASLLDALAEAFREFMPTLPKWARLRGCRRGVSMRRPQ